MHGKNNFAEKSFEKKTFAAGHILTINKHIRINKIIQINEESHIGHF